MNCRCALALVSAVLLSACAAHRDQDSMPVTTPTALPPELDASVRDRRGRFREIACEVLETTGRNLAFYAPCEDVLRRIGTEAGATGQPINPQPLDGRYFAALVPGIGWECFANWLEFESQFDDHMQRLGIQALIMKVDGLSGSARNAEMIRDTFMANASRMEPRSVVLLGYSKGAPDIMEALVAYPEIHPYIAAVVSLAGAVRGSPLADDASEGALKLMQHMPESKCSDGDGLAIESLRPATRKAWLESHTLPSSIPYYSIVTLPEEERISRILRGTYHDLAKIDPRNDSQVIFSDQVIPGSTLVAYLNADHWAMAVPIIESHPVIADLFVDQNDFPREALAEALLRFLVEDLAVVHQDRDDHRQAAEQQ